MKNVKKTNAIIIISIILVAVVGSVFVNMGIDWFNGLVKPTQWISNIVIPILWTIIYILFGIVLLVWNNKNVIPFSTKILLVLNGISNVLWCLVFFTFKQLFFGNIVIVINIVLAYYLIANIYLNKKLYGILLIIYPLWVSIATTLNIALWILN